MVAACPPTGLVRALFGATMPSSVEELARSVMTDPVRVSVGARSAAVVVSNRQRRGQSGGDERCECAACGAWGISEL